MSTIIADNLTGKTSAGNVTITDGSVTYKMQDGLAKVLFAMNLSGTTYMTVANNTLSTQTLNISSGTDAGTGKARGNLTNAMDALDYIWCEGIKAGNNTANLDVGFSTTSLIAYQMKDCDSNADRDEYSTSSVMGDLA